MLKQQVPCIANLTSVWLFKGILQDLALSFASVENQYYFQITMIPISKIISHFYYMNDQY